jgi:hypothetical protein
VPRGIFFCFKKGGRPLLALDDIGDLVGDNLLVREGVCLELRVDERAVEGDLKRRRAPDLDGHLRVLGFLKDHRLEGPRTRGVASAATARLLHSFHGFYLSEFAGSLMRKDMGGWGLERGRSRTSTRCAP